MRFKNSLWACMLCASVGLMLAAGGCSQGDAPDRLDTSRATAGNPADNSQELTVDEQSPITVPVARDSVAVEALPSDATKSASVEKLVANSNAATGNQPTKEAGSSSASVTSSETVISPDAESMQSDAEKPLKIKQVAAVVKSSSESEDQAKTKEAPENRRPAENVQEQLARMRARMLGLPEPTDDAGPPKELKLLIPEKEFETDTKHNALRITFDDIDLLKVLNAEPVPVDIVDHMPAWLTNLHGKRVVLRGWMYPAGRADGIKKFMFVRDSGLCCFGSNPKIYDKLAVTMRDGQTCEYIEGRPFDVVATLKIEADIFDDELFFLYHLEDSMVIDH